MADRQPALFESPPLAMVQWCHWCGLPVCKVDVAPDESWYAAVLWNYVGLQDHLKVEHPDKYREP